MWIVDEIIEKMKRPFPQFEKEKYRPIYQIETVITYLRRRGTPEDELDRIREKNYCAPILFFKTKKTKKKPLPIFIEQKKILKPVIKKMYM